MALVEEVQKLLSTSKVKDALLGSATKLIQRTVALKKKRQKRADVRSLPPVAVNMVGEVAEAKSQSRYISTDVSHAVRQRDNCQCTFISGDGRRCSETRRLQIDHIVPFALGGKSSVGNLRLLCPAHNQHEAERVFGEAAIRGLVKFKQNERLARSAG
jgi:hypothetical protein